MIYLLYNKITFKKFTKHERYMKTIKTIFLILFSTLLFYSCGSEEQIIEEIIRPVKVKKGQPVFDYQLKDLPGVTQETLLEWEDL